MMCPAVTTESSMSFKDFSSLQVDAKPSPAASKSARGYKDLTMPRVRLTNCFTFGENNLSGSGR
jgi:hypothetical protein